jgi:plastocyanin
MRARVVALFTVLVLPVVAVLPAGAGGGRGGLCTTVSTTNELTMRDFCFDGVAHVTTAGSTITVTNQGQTAHNLVAVEGGFRVEQLNPGERSELEVDRPGVYQYYCTLHGSAAGAGMAGVLVVEDQASLATVRSKGATAAPAALDTSATTAATRQPGSAWGWVALGALLLAGAALCVSLALVRPRRA